MMLQWQACKESAQGALLLFRLGDFYEAFYEDGITLAKELDLTLTKRQEIPMAGVPFHTCEAYIDKLVAKGYRVAIAEQVEDARLAKGLVKREIVRIVTPGTVVTSSLLSEKSNNFIACITQLNTLFGLAWLDLTTADFTVMQVPDVKQLLDALARLSPSELIASEKMEERHPELFKELRQSCVINTKPDWVFDHQNAFARLLKHFQVHTLDGFGLKGMIPPINAAGALLSYVNDDLALSVSHIKHLKVEQSSHYMALDRATQRHLELIDRLHEGKKGGTLLSLLDETVTPMGARLLKQWITHPLLSVPAILERQEAIGAFASCLEISEPMEKIRDLERLIMRISTGYATPRDLLGLRLSLEPLPAIAELLSKLDAKLICEDRDKLADVSAMTEMIKKALVDDPPLRLSEGGIIRSSYSPQLEELRSLKANSQAWIANYQTHLRDTTQIKTLKIGFTNAFGYYIEVSRGQAENMPASFERRQTLVNAERFISPELKDYEHKILTAEERMKAIESELFLKLRHEIAAHADTVQAIAAAIARLDVLLALAKVAKKRRYVRPIVDESALFTIEEGRHPIIETDGSFIPNDVRLHDKEKLMLITGPNMAGKSTYIRQVALIAILAQMGSYVPAKSAHIGIIDKVFSRIGASDDLARGQSTFMVEMTETANILHNATARSLVILDEIGRGTSTYDGISIAWAVAEYLLMHLKAKTLFATHYWELTELEKQLPGAVNYNVAVQETDRGIVFLRKILKGGTDKSYGIHVARLAGLPNAVLARASEMLSKLEKKNPSASRAQQLSLFD